MATSWWEEAKLTLSAHPTGRAWRPMGADGLGESGESSCLLLSRVWGLAEGGWGQRGKVLCSSTSSIPCLLNSMPSLWAEEPW